MKQSKNILLIVLLWFCNLQLQAQFEPEMPQPPPPEMVIDSSMAPVPDDTEMDNAVDNFVEGYNFRDEEQTDYNSKKLDPQFDKAYWEKERRAINFNESRDTLKPKKNKKDSTEKLRQKSSKHKSSFNLADLKFVFIGIAIVLIILLIVYLIKNSGARNLKVNSNILVNFDDLDETTLRNAELLTPLNLALKAGDYQTAYRIKYLEVLQQLIHKNLIYYKKEKTNYEYLLQLSGKNVYEPFRQLTFNFDGIWYGEMKIDQARYESLLPYFNQFETTISQN